MDDFSNFISLKELINRNGSEVKRRLMKYLDLSVRVLGNKNGKFKTTDIVVGENGEVTGTDFVVEKDGKVLYKIPINEFLFCIEKRLELYIDEFKKTSKKLKNQGIDLFQDIEEQVYSIEDANVRANLDIGILEISNFILTYQRVKSIFSTKEPSYKEFNNRIKKQFEELKGMMSKQNFEKYAFFSSYMGLIQPDIIDLLDSKVNEGNTYYTENDAIEIVRKYSNKKTIKETTLNLPSLIYSAPTSYIRKLESMGYITDDCKGIVYFDIEALEACKKNLNYEGRFLTGQSCISAYKLGLIDQEHFKKYIDIEKMFNTKYLVRNKDKDFAGDYEQSLYFVDNTDGKLTRRDHGKMIMEMIYQISNGRPLSQDNKNHCTVGVWNYYANGFFSAEDVKTLIKDGHIFEEDILSDFNDLHKIKHILGEYKEPIIDEGYTVYPYIFFDEDIVYDVFDTDILVRYFDKEELSEPVKKYINKHLRKQYEKANKDLSKDFFESALKLFEEQNYNDAQKAKVLYNLYCEKMISADQICSEEISEDTVNLIVDLGKDNNSAIIDFYNCGFINEYQMFDKYSEDAVIGLINDGLNPSVLNEFYCFEEVVDLILDKKIVRACDMSYYRNEENIKKINKMYQPTRSDENNSKQGLSDVYTYDDLNTLVLYGILTAEEAEEIDKDYDYKEKISILKENGLIVGNKNGIKAKREPDGNSHSKHSRNPGEIEIPNKYDLFFALDEECDEYAISSDVLKNYSLIIFPNLKIAIMEPTENGKGASYVMSIKLALDQISNDKSDGESKEDPLKVYKNRTGIRSIPGMEVVNHGENWGRNIVKKMKNIHSDVSNTIFAGDSEDKVEEHKLKIESIQEKMRKDYLKTRNDANNIMHI